jgi:hypothetical protein
MSFRSRAFVVALAAASLGSRSAAQGLRSVVVEAPETFVDLVLWDADGDGRNDLLTTAAGPRLDLRRARPDGGYDAPRAATAPPDATAFVLTRGKDGVPEVFVDAPSGARTLRFADFVELTMPPRDRASPPPLSFATDLDGDGAPDVVLPAEDGFAVRRSGGGGTAVRPPVRVRTVAEEGGLVFERRSYARANFERLAAGSAARPVRFADGALRALRGDFTRGFGPEEDVVVRFAPDRDAAPEGALERNEARLADLDGDGTPEALLVRTRTKAGAVAGARTELVFKRLGDADAKPAQALLLPGVLSNGPDVRDLDGDGRPDLSLSVFGDDLQSQMARGLRGTVKLTYYVYRGTGGATPFEKTPAFSLEDDVPAAQFDDWSLRHRYLFDAGWSGGPRPDLLHVKVGAASTDVEIRPATAEGALGYAAAKAPLRLPFALTDFRPWGFSPGVPALLCRAPGRIVIVAAR